MTVLPRLEHSYASELSDLVVPWDAAEFPQPHAVIINDGLARALGMDPGALRTDPGMLVGAADALAEQPVAMAYSGHQFGAYAPRLGDGRALLLGEAELAGTGPVDLHLKGSGPTPFSRGGDGLATLGPMLREYLVSEALHALGIPTSRSLAVVTTGAPVRRETWLPGAVLTRVAASHIRVGTFQLARGDESVLRRLADYAIARHYPEYVGDYRGFFRAVIAAQAELVAQWMGVGFIHGVMNTDNTTVSGETIDYGPCAFLDQYDPRAVFSSIDHQGRYSYGNQPAVLQWNLARFGEALLPLLGGAEAAQEDLASFSSAYEHASMRVFAAKIGLQPGPEAAALGVEFLEILSRERLDFTASFRRLTEDGEADLPVDSPELRAWLASWRALGPEPAMMARANPVFIPRNFPLQEALNAAVDGDLTPFHDLLALVTHPYTLRPAAAEYLEPGPGGFRTFCGT